LQSAWPTNHISKTHHPFAQSFFCQDFSRSQWKPIVSTVESIKSSINCKKPKGAHAICKIGLGAVLFFVNLQQALRLLE
jgi:hypothetical protein